MLQLSYYPHIHPHITRLLQETKPLKHTYPTTYIDKKFPYYKEMYNNVNDGPIEPKNAICSNHNHNMHHISNDLKKNMHSTQNALKISTLLATSPYLQAFKSLPNPCHWSFPYNGYTHAFTSRRQPPRYKTQRPNYRPHMTSLHIQMITTWDFNRDIFLKGHIYDDICRAPP